MLSPSSDNSNHHVANESDTPPRDSAAIPPDAPQQSAWEAYIQAHPLITCGTAAALGFVVAPRVRHRSNQARPLHAAGSEQPQVDSSPADVGGTHLASDLLMVAAATVAEQSVAQLFGLGRELFDKSSKPPAGRPASANRRPVDASVGPQVDQQSTGAAAHAQSLEAALKNVDLAQLEQRFESVAAEHPLASVLSAAAIGLFLGLMVKR